MRIYFRRAAREFARNWKNCENWKNCDIRSSECRMTDFLMSKLTNFTSPQFLSAFQHSLWRKFVRMRLCECRLLSLILLGENMHSWVLRPSLRHIVQVQCKQNVTPSTRHKSRILLAIAARTRRDGLSSVYIACTGSRVWLRNGGVHCSAGVYKREALRCVNPHPDFIWPRYSSRNLWLIIFTIPISM